jgi:hypothetical protein
LWELLNRDRNEPTGDKKTDDEKDKRTKVIVEAHSRPFSNLLFHSGSLMFPSNVSRTSSFVLYGEFRFIN